MLYSQESGSIRSPINAEAFPLVMRDIIIQAYYQQSFIFHITRRAVGRCVRLYAQRRCGARDTGGAARARDTLAFPVCKSAFSAGRVRFRNINS